METVTGVVAYITIESGRSDVVGIRLESNEENKPFSHYYVDVVKGIMTWNGALLKLGKLVEMLTRTEYPVKVTLHPDVQRYGVSTKTAFFKD